MATVAKIFDRPAALGAAVGLLCIGIVSCGSGTKAVPDQTGTGEGDGYSLVWADYFDAGKLDPEKWNCEENGFGGGNAELQYYLPENVSVGQDPRDGRGCLIIQARKQAHKGKAFTSGRINTEGKFSFTYGKVEARIKFPATANGLWPAFWLLGADMRSNAWPACGEMDIVEMGHSRGIADATQDRYFNGACHWGEQGPGGLREHARHLTAEYSLQDGEYHLYTMYWDRERIAMFLDKDRYPETAPYFTMDISDTQDPLAPGHFFHHDYYILLNLAVGGFFPGLFESAEITALADKTASMYVDFVKVYQK